MLVVSALESRRARVLNEQKEWVGDLAVEEREGKVGLRTSRLGGEGKVSICDRHHLDDSHLYGQIKRLSLINGVFLCFFGVTFVKSSLAAQADTGQFCKQCIYAGCESKAWQKPRLAEMHRNLCVFWSRGVKEWVGMWISILKTLHQSR